MPGSITYLTVSYNPTNPNPNPITLTLWSSATSVATALVSASVQPVLIRIEPSQCNLATANPNRAFQVQSNSIASYNDRG